MYWYQKLISKNGLRVCSKWNNEL